ncbi:MAG TPA: DUF308 domain-containing protein [Gemmatimonadales bacterium]|nr:DUF308 domain-containing protein [Gemmatimonadales bacterium]
MPVAEDVKRMYRLTWWALFLRGLLGIAVGILVLARPMDSVAALALVIAFWALFSGFTMTLQAFELRQLAPHWGLLLLSGLVSIAFGVAAMIYYPGLSLTFAVVLTSWWLLITGAVGIWAAVMERKLGAPWGWTAAFGVLAVLAGVFALMSPPATLAAILGLIAAYALISGVAFIAGAFKLRGAVQMASQARERMTA